MMPTQEERLTAVENDLKRFKVETVKSYQDAVVDLAMVKGLGISTLDRLTALREQFTEFRQEVLERFERQDRRFDAQDAHLNLHDRRFDQMDQRFDTIDHRLEQLMQAIIELSSKMS